MAPVPTSSSPSRPASITLRPPTTSTLPQPPTFVPPTLDFLARRWHVTHSTLPMWRSKRDVCITYKPIHCPDSTQMEDIVTYYALGGGKEKQVLGIDTMAAGGEGDGEGGRGRTGEWDWRGKGWLKIASSHWEVLGYGMLRNGEEEGGEEAGRWAVTYFAKTLFTPAGVDVYADTTEGLPKEVLEGIKEALGKSEDGGVRKLAGELFEVKREGAEMGGR